MVRGVSALLFSASVLVISGISETDDFLTENEVCVAWGCLRLECCGVEGLLEVGVFLALPLSKNKKRILRTYIGCPTRILTRTNAV